MQRPFSLKEYYLIFKRHILKIIAGGLLGAFVGFAFMTYFVTPIYQSQTEILVNQQDEQSIVRVNEINNNIQLINTYRAIITGYSMLTQVDENLDNRFGVNALREAIQVDQPAESQTFYITAEMTSPEDAQMVVGEVTDIFRGIVEEVYGSNVVIYELSPPSYEPNPVRPQRLIHVLMGSFLAVFLSVIYVLFLEMMDNTVKDTSFFVQQGVKNLGFINQVSSKQEREMRKKQEAEAVMIQNIQQEIKSEV